MIRAVNARLFSVFKKTRASTSSLTRKILVSSNNLQSNVMISYCTSNCVKDDSDNESIYKNVNFEEITNGDLESTKKLKKLMFEIENYCHEGELVPKKITVSEWKHLLELPGPKARLKYLKFLAKNEFKRNGDKRKKLKKIINYVKKTESLNVPDHINYSLKHNNLFMKIAWGSILRLYEAKCCTAMLHSNNIVFDLDYESYMTTRDVNDCVRQILMSAFQNRYHINPLNLHFCNAPTEGKMKDQLKKYGECSKVFNCVNIHEESYLEIFDPKTLVYLSPYARQELHEYNPDDVYIIGAYKNRVKSLPVSVGKAKAEKIRVAKLPLDVYLKWKQGRDQSSLPLNIIFGILLDLNYFKDMKKALFKNVPPRLYCKDDELPAKSRTRLAIPTTPSFGSRKKMNYLQHKKPIRTYGSEEYGYFNNFRGR